MALINCSMEKEAITISSGGSNAPSITLEIIPDPGYVVAARDFVTGDYSGFPQINSITLTDSESSGGPQNDGAYTANNKVIVTVDFDNAYVFNESVILDIDPSGEATIEYLTPVKLQGTFTVPSSPTKCTFVASNVVDYASSAATDDFYVYDNPGKSVVVMNMTIAATSGDFLNVKPTAVVTNSSEVVLDEDYDISSEETFDSNNRLTQVVYTIKTNLISTDRSGDVITFSGAGADIPVPSVNISSYTMDKSDLGLDAMRRDLFIYGDSGAEFRIKVERGTLSTSNPPVFTVDSTDGEYVFDNTLQTIAEAFYPSGSNITYPSEIDSGGSYIASTDPYTLDSDGVFFKKIVIPEDVDGKVYRFTITPEAGTAIDPNAPDIDTSTNPDVITFDIERKSDIVIDATASTSRSLTATTVEYYDYDSESRGYNEPTGKKDSIGEEVFDVYSYRMVLEDDVDFHLPNEYNEFNLTDQNYAITSNGGSVNNLNVTAHLKSSEFGFFYGEIQSTGYDSHIHAEAHEPDTDIVLTTSQRNALTNGTGFNAKSFSDSFTTSEPNIYFKIKYFTTDAVPVYKSQTIKISENLEVAGEGEHQNVTVENAPPVDRSKLYIDAIGFNISKWGNANMSIAHNLDTFTFATAQTGVTTLNVSVGIKHLLKNFLNDIASEVGYVNDLGFSQTMLVSNDSQASYVNSNITTNTTHVKFTISGAFLVAEDRLPELYNTGNYQINVEQDQGSSELSNALISIPTPPTVSLVNGSSVYRKLTISNFDIVVDFNNTLTSLNAGEDYAMPIVITHQLSQQYKSISDIEADYGDIATGLEIETY